jgi:SAM-dependent methyltransferase
VLSREVAEVYDSTSSAMFAPAVIEPTVDVLTELAGDGAAVEFAIGTGRVAIPLKARGVRVAGIELSPHMVEQLRAKPASADIPVVIGDMTSTRIPGEFSLVYLVWNTISNVTTQAEQVAVFLNAAAHLRPGGAFLVELGVPQLPPPGQTATVFAMEQDHVGIDTIDDPVAQLMSSHHWTYVNGGFLQERSIHRYAWPSELDLMAQLAGLRLSRRWSGWDREPFNSASASHVSTWVKA